jgi:mono/diheme cytochrome c family protein
VQPPGIVRVTGIPAATIAIASLATVTAALAADIAAGMKTFESTCAACHPLASYAGKSDAELQAALKGMVAGTVNHPKKLTLSAIDIANLAAYISSTESK